MFDCTSSDSDLENDSEQVTSKATTSKKANQQHQKITRTGINATHEVTSGQDSLLFNITSQRSSNSSNSELIRLVTSVDRMSDEIVQIKIQLKEVLALLKTKNEKFPSEVVCS